MDTAEIRLGMTCRCGCGTEYDGTVVTRVGNENYHLLMRKIQEDPDLACQLTHVIEEALGEEETAKIEEAAQEAARKRAAGDPGWDNVIGHELHLTKCPACGQGNIPTERYFYFDCDCGRKNRVEKDEPAVGCPCGLKYKADHGLLKGFSEA